MTRGQVLFRILSTLNNAATAYIRHPGRTSGSLYRFMREFRELQDISDRELRLMARYAVEQKYVVFKKEGQRAISLGEKGKNYLVRRMLSYRKPYAWDHKWRIVMFDVPNEQKSERNSFALTLKRAGFDRLQKSVFISPYPCEEEIRALAELLDISDCIDIAVAEYISKGDEYKKHFNLK